MVVATVLLLFSVWLPNRITMILKNCPATPEPSKLGGVTCYNLTFSVNRNASRKHKYKNKYVQKSFYETAQLSGFCLDYLT